MQETAKVWVMELSDRQHYVLMWRDPVTQRRRTKTTTIPRTGLARDRKAAERLAGELESQLADGSVAMPSRFTWAEFRKRYEAEVVPGLAVRTAEKIRGVLDRVEKELNPNRLQDLTESRLSHFVAVLRSAGAKENTVQGYLAHLKATLNWAVQQKYLRVRPAIPRLQRLKKSSGRPMKGRPITAEEFERMLAVVAKVVGEPSAASWAHYLRGLWSSGLRLTESLELWWDRPEKIYPVFQRGCRPMLKIPGELEKGYEDRLLPIAPEFAMLLQQTPEAERTGPVFILNGRVGRYGASEVSRIVSKIGAAAGVVVHADPKKPDSVKYASAHDLRRAFGVRWAARLMPAQLMELMRHESIETTLRFYVGTDAQRTADAAWEAFERAEGPFSDAARNKARNKHDFGPLQRAPAEVPKALENKGQKQNGAAGTRTQDQRIKSPDGTAV